MNIAATKTMADAINKAFKAEGWRDYKASQVMLTEREYSWHVGDVYDAEDYGDYNDRENKYRVIRIIYPADYYACDKFLSSKELNYIFEKGDTLEKYMEKVLEAIEI